MSSEHRPDPPDEDRVPVFGTWRAIYSAVVLAAALVMALLVLFSRWPY